MRIQVTPSRKAMEFFCGYEKDRSKRLTTNIEKNKRKRKANISPVSPGSAGMELRIRPTTKRITEKTDSVIASKANGEITSSNTKYSFLSIRTL